MYYTGAYLLKFILGLFGGIKIYNKEKLPESGGYVLACTHKGWVDVLWLGVSILPMKINYMAKKELFEKKASKWLMNKLNAFPVDRENPGPSSLKIPRRLLKQGEIIGIFPSGTRTSDSVPMKRGAATIASQSKVPLVPASYQGPANLKDLFKRKKATLVFGDPILVSEDLPRKEQLQAMLEQLKNQTDLLEERQSQL